MRVSVVIPVYNEERVIDHCLQSLAQQDYQNFKIIVVDDGSVDGTVSSIKHQVSSIKTPQILFLQQNHQGPGAARNLGAKKASGEILVFVDADMEFEPDFLSKLVAPIISGKAIGTFSKDEYLLNKENVYARLWNLNLGRSAQKMHPVNYPNTQHVFRAILKSKFDKAGGFDAAIGYTDDWSLARKLNALATLAPGAKYYHRNPGSLAEVWTQARWFGKNEFLTSNLIRKIYNLYRYNPLLAIIKGVAGVAKFQEKKYLVFKVVYDSAVFTSVLMSFLKEPKYK